MTTGLIFGKFMPLHLGHEHLIATGLENCDKLYVVICSLSSEPINGDLRYRWICDRFSAAVDLGKMKVIHLKEDWIPQDPSECLNTDAFYGCWAGVMQGLIKTKIDIMFASEEYVYPMAIFLDCKARMVDLKREHVPVSGTSVRNDPFGNWNYINDEVKRYFTKKILIIGSESTGKSTLTKFLAEHFRDQGVDTKEIQEYAREYIDKKLNGDMEKVTFDDISMFGYGQMRMVDQAVSQGYQLIFSDTDAMVSSVFQDFYYGKVSILLTEKADKEEWDLILFLQPDVPWVDDGQRDFPDRRGEFTRKIKKQMDMRGMRYVEISGSWEERQKTSVSACMSI